jgi:hypothetical protein
MANKDENKNEKSALDLELEEIRALKEELKSELEKTKSTPARESTDDAPLRDISRHKDTDYVEVRCFKDGGTYKDDIYVGVNGQMCRIARGVPVRIKRSYAKLISVSERETARVSSIMAEKDGKDLNLTRN